MKKIDPFFILITFLFFILSTAYFALDYQLSGIHFEKAKVARLEKQIQKLKLQNDTFILQSATSHLHNGGRKPASLRPVKEITLDFLYRSQLHSAVEKKRVSEIYSITQKILNSSAESDLIAEALFQKSFASCQLAFKEERCFAELEAVITQFPESKWSGESLVLLSTIYKKLKRFKEADSVLKIVRTEFPNEFGLIQRVSQTEKNQL